jgi:hypothetical protein
VDELVDAPVAQDAVEVVAQRLTRLALDLGDVGNHTGEVAIRLDPLGSGLGADAGRRRQVVGGLADQGREIAVALGGTPYFVATAAGVIRASSETPLTG